MLPNPLSYSRLLMSTYRLFALGIATLIAASPASTQEAAQPGYGADPVTADPSAPQTPGARGDQQRHYYFREAGVELPYRLYVPTSYDPAVPTPLVIALHGYSGTQNYFFQLSDDLPGQLEAHGFIFVAPMGFNRGSWYGNGGPATRDADTERTEDIIVRNGLSVTELGELDVQHVFDIVRSEYNVDPDRTYLMGHSMGGAGTWYLGQKHADRWAAIAPMSGTGLFSSVDPSVMARLPVMVAVGGEETGQLAPSRSTVEQIEAAGGTAVYLELAGEGHVPMIRPAMPQVLAFLARHRRSR
jgi:poly(3-hydroxybutyrate) depolymerase